MLLWQGCKILAAVCEDLYSGPAVAVEWVLGYSRPSPSQTPRPLVRCETNEEQQINRCCTSMMDAHSPSSCILLSHAQIAVAMAMSHGYHVTAKSWVCAIWNE